MEKEKKFIKRVLLVISRLSLYRQDSIKDNRKLYFCIINAFSFVTMCEKLMFEKELFL